MHDLVVIGAGLSGLMAATTAVNAGLSAKVIAKGLGSMHWSAGTIDLFGYDPDNPGEPTRKPLEHIQALSAKNPGHPYAALDPGQISEILASFVALCEEIGLPYGGASNRGSASSRGGASILDENLLLPSPVGAARPTFLAPRAQLAGDLARPEPMLIVGFEGMRDFYPHLIAENLTRLGYQARAAFLPLTLLTDRRDSNTIHLAQTLDTDRPRSGLVAALKRLTVPDERLGLPAILGLQDHTQVMATLESELEIPVFEIPTLPPSVPGVRLFRALQHHLQSKGVRVESGMEVTDYQLAPSENGAPAEVQWVESETSSRPLKHRASQYLLATGGILGGGFEGRIDGSVREVVFDLPLTVPQKRTEWFRPRFLDPFGQPVFNGGVVVNRSFQPVNGEGDLLFGNLRAAGNLLAQNDAIHERSLEGIAVVTGVAAARSLAEGG